MSNKFKVTLYTLQQLSVRGKMQRLWQLLDVPSVSPKYYDAVESAKIPFDSNAAERAAELYKTEGFLFVRGGKDGFLGVFAKQSHGLSTWTIWLNIKAMQGKREQRWLEWIFSLCSEFPVLYGLGCSVAEYDAKHTDIKVLPSGGRISGKVGVSIAEFYQYLPGLYWLNIFGSELVRAFGESTLMTLPDIETHSLDSHQIAICSREPVLPESMEERLKIESRLSDILGSQFFFDRNRPDISFEPVPELADALRTSSSESPEATISTENYRPFTDEELESFENQTVLSPDETPYSHFQNLAEKLVIYLHIEVKGVFTYSSSALEALDTYFVEHPQRLEYKLDYLLSEFIPALGAYLGEVLVRQLGGEWIVRDPLLKSSVVVHGREVLVFRDAYYSVYDNVKLLNAYNSARIT